MFLFRLHVLIVTLITYVYMHGIATCYPEAMSLLKKSSLVNFGLFLVIGIFSIFLTVDYTDDYYGSRWVYRTPKYIKAICWLTSLLYLSTLLWIASHAKVYPKLVYDFILILSVFMFLISSLLDYFNIRLGYRRVQ